MPALTPDQASELAQRASDLLGEASRLTDGTQGEYIRDGNPSSPFEAIPLALARQGCRRYQQKGGDYSDRRAARAERACRPYLDSLEPGSGPELELPFRGGQCNAVYLVNTTTGTPVGGIETFTLRARGPVGGIRARDNGLGQFFYELFCRGIVVGSSSCGSVADTGAAWYFIRSTTSSGGNPTARVNSVTPCGLDNCGNVPPEFTPPKTPATPLPPGPSPFTRSPDIDVDLEVTINPDFTVNVNIGTGPITIDPFGEPAPVDPGGGAGDPGDPTDPGSPGSPIPTGPGGEALGQAPPGTELVGLLVTVAASPGDANKFANNPKQPYRGIGYVRMGYPARLGLDISGGTVISPQFFHAQQRGLTNWSVAANTGFDLTVQPYFRDIET
jgi:hypothetical protein